MRILHVLDHSIPLQSGYAFRTVAILTQQRAFGWETVHLTSAKHYGAEAPEEEVDGFHFYRTTPLGGPLWKLPVANQAAIIRGLECRLREVARRERPDLIHAHSPALNGVASLRVGRALGLPVVYEMRASWEDAAVDHGTTTEGSLRYRLSRSLETWVLRRADAITTISLGLRNDILGRGIPQEKVTLVPNAIDLDRWGPDPAARRAVRTRLGIPDDAPVLGFLGSFYAYEGLHLLLEAIPRLLRHHPALRVLLVGGGPQDDALRAQARELDLGNVLHFTGRIPHEQVAAYYNSVDICVYPRLPIRLTEMVTPLKPLEAMANERVVIASDVGGHRELIRHGETGTLFLAGSSDSLATAVEAVLNDRFLWAGFGARGRQFVETERTWADVARRYHPVYEAAHTEARAAA